MSAKSVVWIHRGGPEMASYRYRALIPAKQIGYINGFQCSINGGDADIAVFSKPTAPDLEILASAKEQKVRVIVDLCDDHFHDNETGALYRKFARDADAVVAPTQEMAKRVLEHTGREAVVIGDPYEQDLKEPHAVGNTALWFGHKSNMGDLTPFTEMLAKHKWELRVATGPSHRNAEWVKWGPKAVEAELAASNVVLLPTRVGAEYKSPNRLLNAIRAGCFAVCQPHPSYEEFDKFCWVGDIKVGLQWVRSFHDEPEFLNGLVREAQSYIEDKFSPGEIARQWAGLLEKVA